MKINSIKIDFQVHVVVLKVGYPKNPVLYIIKVSRGAYPVTLAHVEIPNCFYFRYEEVEIIKNIPALLVSQ